jgi:hypothetical protein
MLHKTGLQTVKQRGCPPPELLAACESRLRQMEVLSAQLASCRDSHLAGSELQLVQAETAPLLRGLVGCLQQVRRASSKAAPGTCCYCPWFAADPRPLHPSLYGLPMAPV